MEEAHKALTEIAKEMEETPQAKEDIFSMPPEEEPQVQSPQKETNKFKRIFDVDEDALMEMLDHTGLRQQHTDSETSSLLDGMGNLTDKEALKFADAINQAFFEKMEEIDNQVQAEVKHHLKHSDTTPAQPDLYHLRCKTL
jgi:hypothetical protein